VRAEGANVVLKHVNLLVDSAVVACMFVSFLQCDFVNHVTRLYVHCLTFAILNILCWFPSMGSLHVENLFVFLLHQAHTCIRFDEIIIVRRLSEED